MKSMQRLIKNYKATNLLKKKYHRITSTIGMLAVFTGIGIFFLIAQPVASVLGTKLPESTVYLGVIMVLMLALLAVCIYLGVLLVAGTFSLIMLAKGEFTKEEALGYTLFSDYPRYWFD